MSLYGVLRTGSSGMTAQSNKLSSIGDNVANADTIGYKKTSTQFSALLLENSGTNFNSGSVETTVRTSVAEQGPTTYTTSDSDLAIGGDGFFVVSDANGNNYLTRAGNFVKDGASGDYVNAAGFTLMGYDLAGGGGTINGYDGLVPVNMSSYSMVATPTTTGTFPTTLPADAAVGDVYESSVKVYDNLGGAVIVTFEMEMTGANQWNLTTTPPGTTTALTFDPTNGTLLTPAAGTVAVDLTASNGQNITFDISKMTQLNTDYTPEATANGNAPSAVEEVEFASDGTVYAVYGDGSKLAAFQVPIATVASPDNLEQQAGGVFSTTLTSGEVQIGTAGTGGRGTITANALEQSNVDLASELTEMIIAQRSYTANSKVFQTGSDLLEVLMNLKR